MQPSEFWALSPQEWWWEYDMRIAEAKQVKDAINNKGGKFTGPEWDKARREHSEKMKAKAYGNASPN